MTHGRQINELAVTLAYALLDVEDVYKSAAPLIAAYASSFALEGDEAEVLFDLVAARLAMSVCISSHRAKDFPDNDYLLISQAPAFRLLERLDQTNPDFLAAFARHAAGLARCRPMTRSSAGCRRRPAGPAAMFDIDLNRSRPLPAVAVERGAGHGACAAIQRPTGAGSKTASPRRMRSSPSASMARTAMSTRATSSRTARFARVALAASGHRHLHRRRNAALRAAEGHGAERRRQRAALRLRPDRHPRTSRRRRWPGLLDALWPSVARDAGDGEGGQEIEAGQQIGSIGDHAVNGGWAPHLHFQIITDRLGRVWRVPGRRPAVAVADLEPHLARSQPDPAARAGELSFRHDATGSAAEAPRANVLGPSLSISYAKKLKMVRGNGAYLYDHTGRAFVDGVNNICHVGHSHPHVVEALARQAAILNTNTRYLHDTILDYAERLGSPISRSRCRSSIWCARAPRPMNWRCAWRARSPDVATPSRSTGATTATPTA